MNKDTRIVKVICAIVGFVCAFCIFGILGGNERGTISDRDFWIWEIICNILLLVSIKIIDIMEQIECGRK